MLNEANFNYFQRNFTHIGQEIWKEQIVIFVRN
jgi:hypothetical protein